MVSVGLASLTLAGGQADAAVRSRRLAGIFTVGLGGSAGCVAPNCATYTFNGALRGTGEGRAIAFLPGEPASNVIAKSAVVIRTAEGNLHLGLTAVFNPDPAGDGEASFLFKIVGGTAALTGASGYVMATGLAEAPGAKASNVVYTGKLTLP